MRPARGLLLVKPIEPEETYAGGSIIVPEVARQRVTMWQCECMEVGESEFCNDADCERPHEGSFWPTWDRIHPHVLAAGQWLLIKPRSYLDTGDPERKLWLVRQCDVVGIFRETIATPGH